MKKAGRDWFPLYVEPYLTRSHIPEGCHVSPPPTVRLARRPDQRFPQPQRRPSPRPGLVQLRHGPGALLLRHRRRRPSRRLARPEARYRQAAPARVVLRGQCQERHPPPPTRRPPLFRPAAAVGLVQLAQRPLGSGPGCHQLGRPLRHLGHQRLVSRLCRARRLEDLARRRQAFLASRVARPAAGVRPRTAFGPHRDRAERPRAVCQVAVPRIQQRGWHPFMRINTGGTFRPAGELQRRPLASLVPQVGTHWQGAGEAFKDAPKRLRCTLLARWDEGYADPWLVVTDLPAAAAEVCWYGLRAWIEQGFKRLKSGGWDWQHTQMTDPGRAERLWLVLAVATWWSLLVGGEAEQAELPVETRGALPQAKPRGAEPEAAARGAGAG